MDYLLSIKTAILIFPFIALFFTIPFYLNQYHKYGSINKLRNIIIYSFILYILIMYFLVILPLPKVEDVHLEEGMVKLIPFDFIINFIKETSFSLSDPSTYITFLKEPCFYTVIFNLIMTIPFGMYLRYYFKCNFIKTIFLTFLLSLFFELTQITGLYFIYPHPYRVFDVDDLIINTLGGIIGFYLSNFFIKYLPSRDKIDKDSYKKGQKVTSRKRIILFLLDLVNYIIISVSLYIF